MPWKHSQPWISGRTLTLVVSLTVVGMLTLSGAPLMAGEGSNHLPRAVDLNSDPDIFETNLVAQEAEVDLGNGLLARAQTFNGTVPGPEFKLKLGDRVIVHFTNRLPEPSSIHWHGIELDNESDGTGITQNPVLTGETFTYRFIVPRPGIFFYHSHIAPTNPSFKGYYGSIIVKDPAEQKLIARKVLPTKRNTMTLVLGDTTVCKAAGSNDAVTFPADPTLPWVGTEELPGNPPFPGLLAAPSPEDLCETPRDHHGAIIDPPVPLAAGDIPNIEPGVQAHGTCNPPGSCPAPRTNEGQLVLTNGKVPAARSGSPSAPGPLSPGADVTNVKAGEGIRLQLASATTTRYLRLRMTDQTGQQVTLFRIGGQGGLLDAVRVEGGIQGSLNTLYKPGEILLPVAAREDVVFVVPEGKKGDIVTLWTLDYPRIGAGPSPVPGQGAFSGLPSVPVAHFRIVGAASKNERFTIAAGDPLLLNPAVNAPTEDLKGLPVDALIDPPPATGSADETLSLTTAGLPAIDNVDGFLFDVGLPGGDFETIPSIASSRFAALGDLLELTISNESNVGGGAAHHPWHPHGFSIQPVRFVENAGGTTVFEFDYNEFVDVVDIPPGHSLVYRVRLDDRPKSDFATAGGALGRWAMHCHIFFHAGLGMITELQVVEP
jgi:FtsP/CotA-like multicopper oxidase with cupredoxin domain